MLPRTLLSRRALGPVAAAAATAGLLIGAAPAPAADLFVAPNGSDAGSCTSAAPCRTLDRAYHVAASGQTVQVAAGSYPAQAISPDATKTAAVVFAAAGKVTLGNLSIRASHVDVRDITTGFVNVEGGAPSDVTVRNGGGSGLFIGGGASGVSFVGGSYGGAENVAPVKIQGTPAPSNISFDGVRFHDAIRTDNTSHLECMYAADVQGLTVRRSRFENCAIFDLFLTNLSGKNPRDVLLENNVFDATASHAGQYAGQSRGYYAVSVSNHITQAVNYQIRYSSFGQPIDFSAGSYQNVRVVGNVGPQASCPSGVTFSHNVWSGTKCGASDRQAPLGFRDPGSYDYGLSAGAAAIDAGDPGDAPSMDLNGMARPVGAAPDAGAIEYGASTPATSAPAPGTSTGSTGSTGSTPDRGDRRKGRRTRTKLRVSRVSISQARSSRGRAHHQQRRVYAAVRGHVRNGHRGRVAIVLERRVKGHWRRAGVRRVHLHGKHHRFRARVRIARRGHYRVHAWYSGDSRTRSSSSRHVRFHWPKA